ncbi:MAG: hypothetical protein ACK4HV_03665 [Parachlamydiaceae bacterium]
MGLNSTDFPRMVRDNYFLIEEGDIPAVALKDLTTSANCFAMNKSAPFEKGIHVVVTLTL